MQSGARGNAVSSISMRSLPTTAAAATMSSKPAVHAKMTPASSQTLCDVPTTFSAPVKKGTVRFNSSIRIRPIPSLSFVSDKEKREIWYYEDEISGFKETIRLDVRHMRQQMRETELAPEHINDTNDRCCRGIEHFATRDSLMRQETAKTVLIESVLREQAHLSDTMPSVDTCDGDSSKPSTVRTDAIAQAVCDVSTRLSLEARSRAATLGASDRAFIAVEESALRALLASHNLASPTARTDVSLAPPTRGYARSASSIQSTNTAGTVERSLSLSCLKRSACSVPNMMKYATPGTSPSAAIVQAYEQVATHRRRRLSLLRESLLASMNISDSSMTQELQNHQQQHCP